ncbi:MAG: hypothetical protein ICV60_00435 [Pyrinomonadaceae bacterium]|nr:hypothetical protein [Pyrinomonadaceae bacterium]
MKKLAFRFSAACLTFFVGTVSISFFVKSRNRLAVSIAEGQTLSIAEAKREIERGLASDKLEKIADLPARNEYYEWNWIQFISESDGWLKADEKLWSTRDGGKTWKLIFDGGVYKPLVGSSETEPNSIYDFQFINAQVGWLLQGGRMFKTVDGGRSWEPFAESLMASYEDRFSAPFYTFKFLPDGRRGWIAGGSYRHLKEGESVANRYSSNNGKEGMFGAIFSTEDGGRTWRKQLLQGSGHIGEIFFLDGEHAWAVGTSGAYYLKNGRWLETETDAWDEKGNVIAESLDVVIGAPTCSPVAVYFLNSQLGWLSNSNGYLAKSIDGGKTWQDIVNIRDYQDKDWPLLSLYPLYFRDSLHGWALGSDGAIRQTLDGGATWKKLEADVEFTNIFFLDSWHGWAISKDGLYRIKRF